MLKIALTDNNYIFTRYKSLCFNFSARKPTPLEIRNYNLVKGAVEELSKSGRFVMLNDIADYTGISFQDVQTILKSPKAQDEIWPLFVNNNYQPGSSIGPYENISPERRQRYHQFCYNSLNNATKTLLDNPPSHTKVTRATLASLSDLSNVEVRLFLNTHTPEAEDILLKLEQAVDACAKRASKPKETTSLPGCNLTDSDFKLVVKMISDALKRGDAKLDCRKFRRYGLSKSDLERLVKLVINNQNADRAV